MPKNDGAPDTSGYDEELNSGPGSNPAAPKGMRQSSRQDAPNMSEYDTFLGIDQKQGGAFVQDAKAWYNGGNLNGTGNGWNTEWMQTAFDQQREAQQQAMKEQNPNEAFNWTKRDDATGVVLWNDPAAGHFVGDVYNAGRKVGNVYDDYGRQGGDLLLLKFLADGKTQQRLFADSDPINAVHREVRSRIDEFSNMREGAKEAFKLQKDIDARQEKLYSGPGNELMQLGGGIGGGLLGGAAGFVATGFNPLGAAAGFSLGAAAGGYGAHENQDLLTEQWARAQEITSRANAKYNDFQATMVGLKEFGGASLRYIQPLSNIVQGLDDSKIGDGVSDFYAVDADGNRKASKLTRGLDLAATLADSFLQFGSPAGAGLYMLGTGASVLGGAGELASTGAGFDDRAAGFHQYQGFSQWFGAVGNVGIDAVQFGTAGALVRAGIGGRAAFATEEASQSISGRATQRLRSWFGEAEGRTSKEINGLHFTVDEATDTALKARVGLSIAAPSEFMRYVPTAAKARRLARADGARQVTADDYYQAAKELAGGNRFAYALINGWAEGSEEFAQGILEPMSFNQDIDTRSLTEAFFYGAAAGAGMSAGNVTAPPTTSQVTEWRARTLYQMRNNTGQLTDEQWSTIRKGLSKRDMEKLSLPSVEETEAVRKAIQTQQQIRTVDMSQTSTLGSLMFADLQQSALAKDLARANPNTEGVLQLAGFSGDKVIAPSGEIDSDVYAPNAGVGSAWQTIHNVLQIGEGLKLQAKSLVDEVTAKQEEIVQAAGNQEVLDRLNTELADLEARVQETNGLLRVSKAITSDLAQSYEQLRGPNVDRDQALQIIAEINQTLSDAFHGQMTDGRGQLLDPKLQEFARRSVEMKVQRHPLIGVDSTAILMPQVSPAMTNSNTHGVLATHQAMLLAPGADRDGDTAVTLNHTYIPQASLDNLRAGGQYVQPVSSREQIGTDAAGNPLYRTTEAFEAITDPPDSEGTMVDLLRAAAGSSSAAHVALFNTHVDELTTELYNRYQPYIEDAPLLKLLSDFKAAVSRGEKAARMDLINGLLNAAPRAVRYTLGKDTGVPEILHLQQRISLMQDRFQRDYAAVNPELEFTPKDMERDLPAEQALLRSRAVESAATAGQTMSLVFRGSDPTRVAQSAHYSNLFRAATLMAEGDFTTEQANEFIRLYALTGSNTVQSEGERIQNRNAIQNRVVAWLNQMIEERVAEGLTKQDALVLLANTRVGDFNRREDGRYEFVEGEISMLQMLLRRSIEIEKTRFRETIAQDEQLEKKIKRLEGLTRREADERGHSVTASLAFFEVFGALPVSSLLGESAVYLGANLSMQQLANSLSNRTRESRNRQLYRWRRKAPYLLGESFGDAPFSAGAVTSGQLSAYRVLVDAIAAEVQTRPRARREQNKRIYDRFLEGIGNIQRMLESLKAIHPEMSDLEPHALVKALIDEHSDTLGPVLVDLFPEAGRVGSLMLRDGQIFASPWITEMLVQDPEQAAVTYRVQTWLDEWQALDPAQRRMGKLKSRFLQLMFTLDAEDGTGFEMNRLLLALNSAKSLPELMDLINNEPAWRGDHAEYLAFFDDVAEFDTDPSQVWSANAPGQLQREAIEAFRTKTDVMARVMQEYALEIPRRRALISSMENRANNAEGRKYYAKLEQIIENRRKFPDHAGLNSMDMALARVQESIMRIHDKGKGDPKIKHLGEFIVLADEIGVKQSLFQTVDALTTYDVQEVLSNPTILVNGPIRLTLPDGASLVLDLSTADGVLAALKNDATYALAAAVIAPTARDINPAGVVQSYLDVDQLTLKGILDEADFSDVFPPAGQTISTSQAYKYIGLTEAAMRREAIGKGTDAQNAAFYPLSRGLMDFITAYTHRPGANVTDLEGEREKLVRDFAAAQQQLAALDARDPSGQLTQQVYGILKLGLQTRVRAQSLELLRSLNLTIDQGIEDIVAFDAVAQILTRRYLQLQETMGQAGATPESITETQTQLDSIKQLLDDRVASMQSVLSDPSVQGVLNMFRLTGSKTADVERKTQILSMLQGQNRLARVRGDYRLIDYVKFQMSQDPSALIDDDRISADQWAELGGYAATIFLSERTGRVGSEVDITPLLLSQDGAEMHRYFDQSWSYLLDPLFDAGARKWQVDMAVAAKALPDLTVKDVAGDILSTLFNEKKLGKWTDLIPSSATQIKKAMASGPTGLALPAGGVLPATSAAYVGAGRYTFEQPTANMATPMTVQVSGGAVNWTREQFLKLNNHFIRTIYLNGAGPNGDPVDLRTIVGEEWLGDDSVANGPYKVLNLQKLNDELTKYAHGDFDLEIEYFDVDAKPFAREWANNIYFEGVGRLGGSGVAPSLLSEVTFAQGAVSKQAQQNPLNTATKGGRGYGATFVTPLTEALTFEAGSTLSEMLQAKTLYLLDKEYDIGTLHPGDVNSLHKLLKQRHLIAGENADGETELMWVEQGIEWERANQLTISDPTFPLSNVRLIPISDRVARTLLGEPGVAGLTGTRTIPKLNLDELDTFPSLSKDRLAELGLSRLGQATSLADAPSLRRLPLQRLSDNTSRSKQQMNRYEQTLRQFKEQAVPVRTARREARKFNIAKINERAMETLQRGLSAESLAPLFQRLNIPWLGVRDLTEVEITKAVQDAIVKLTQANPTSVIFQHIQGGVMDPSAGMLSEIATQDEFRDLKEFQLPTIDDTVVISLDQFNDVTGGDRALAYDLAKDVVTAYAKRGVTIMLVSVRGATELRTQLADFIHSRTLGYDRMAGSAHIFVPVNTGVAENQSRRALESTLTSVQRIRAESISATLLTDRFGDATSENASIREHFDDQVINRTEALGVIPTELGAAYNLPTKGVGALDQFTPVKERILELIETPEGRDYLRKLSGGDPRGTPIYKRETRADGTVIESPGIRGFDDAIERLRSVLASNKHPLTVGEELMTGDFLPLYNPFDKSIMFLRNGFKVPNYVELRKQLKTAVSEANDAGIPNVAIATNELAEEWTTRPLSEITELRPDPLFGTSIRVRYMQNPYGKWTTEADGFKTVASPMPDDVAGPVEDLAPNGFRVNSYRSRKSAESKEALLGMTNNFRWGFALAGIDFRRDMVQFITGKKNLSDEDLAREWGAVNTFLTELGRLDTGLSASDLMNLLDSDTFSGVLMHSINTVAQQVLGKNLIDPANPNMFSTSRDPNRRLGTVFLAALMAPGVRIEDIISTSGILGLEDRTSAAQITLMPQVFTDMLDDYNHPELREMLVNRLNASLPRRADGTRPYMFDNTMRFMVKMRNPQTGQDEKGYTNGVLQLSLELPADENPVNYVQSGVRRMRQDISQHNTFTTFETIGGHVALQDGLHKLKETFNTKGVEDWADSESGGFWQMLRAHTIDESYKPWTRLLPLQQLYVQEGDEKVARYLQPLQSKEKWSATEAARYKELQALILDELRLRNKNYGTEIDYAVRQFAGRPGPSPEQDPEVGYISGALAVQIAELMLTNVRNYRVPTYGGVVPLPHETFLALVFKANEHETQPWAPKTGNKKRSPLASGWAEWVETTIGQVLEAEDIFNPMFRTDLDGFWHTYQNATDELSDMALSTDEQRNVKLMDKDSNLYIASLDPNVHTLQVDPGLLEVKKRTLYALTGHEQSGALESARTSSTSELAETIEAHAKWLKTKRAPKADKASIKTYRERGAWYTESSRDTHSFFHNVINLSIFMRLLNPALWTSAVIEVWVRQSLEQLTDVVTGNTKFAARVGEALGIEQVLSVEDRQKIDKLAEKMGASDEFIGEIYDELTYKSLVEHGRKTVGTGLEKMARFSAIATSDPRFGMLAKSVAKRYLHNAYAYMLRTDNLMSVDSFVANLNEDPLYLLHQFEPVREDMVANVPLNPHRVGVNGVSQVRSMKATVPGKVMMSGIDALTRNDRFGWNALGHVLKIPFLFTPFNMNSLITMSGMGGFDQLLAMSLDQRSGKLTGALPAWLKSALSGREYNADEKHYLEMGDVLEGVDLVRPFVKTAVTHTGLMVLASAAQGLNLSGDDDESRRRRRLAHYLNTPFYYDPRQAQNDFTNADAIFLDSLPGPLESLFRFAPGVDGEGPRSAIVPHWIIRQFTSPIIGIERFFETGDTRQIKWGFGDAFSALPNSVVRLWHDASMTSDMLIEAARDEDRLATPSHRANATQLLFSAVGVYEKSLLENSFVNAWRNGSDQYDRNPWTLPQVTKTGDIVRKEGVPLETKEMVQYIDPETGEVKQHYKQRSDWEARLHQFAENNFTAAAILSITTGQLGTDSDYWRKNMVPTERTFELPPATREEAEAFLLSALDGTTPKHPGALPMWTEQEIESILKNQAQAKGQYWKQDEITAQAKKMLADPRYNSLNGAMSLWDKDNREVLTKDGARGIFQALSKGMVKIGDPSLRGIWIDSEMRHDIAVDWSRELIQEGVDLGLSETVAIARAKRLWYGSSFGEQDRVGIGDIIYSDQIPNKGDVTYRQLNTTYTMGPDGKPWATPFGRDTFLQALGVPWPHRAVMTDQGGITTDQAGNTVDSLVGINTGLKALERVEGSWQIDRPDDIFKEATDGVKFKPNSSTSPYGYHGYKSGGGSGGGGAYFNKMYALPNNISPYGNTIPAINISNPIIRRADIRRERVWSERGRLNQWQ